MRSKEGFSLFELATVVVVIALIAAGIVAARSIIRTSQIQAMMGEYEMYSSAVTNFKNKYLELPGDFAGATAIWGEASGSCQVASATGTATCNGDGDGVIEFDNSNYEHIAAWRHLGLSGFIPQNFTGNTVSGGACNIDIRGGQNAPASKLKGASWNIGASIAGTPYTTGAAGTQYIPMNICTNLAVLTVLWLGGSLQDDNGQAAGCAGSQIPVLTGAEAFEIDEKYDNKRSTGGKIRAQYNNTATYQTCEDLSSANGRYRTDATGTNCALAFIIDP